MQSSALVPAAGVGGAGGRAAPRHPVPVGDPGRELGTSTLNLWRSGVRPNAQHLPALQDLACRLNLAHLLPSASVRQRS